MDNREFGCFFVGVGVGVAIGILGATQPGKQAGRRVKAKAEGAGESTSSNAVRRWEIRPRTWLVW